jgi:hypothetical protein
MADPQTTQSTSLYYVNHEGKRCGPFELRMIEAMVLAGLFPASKPIRKDKTEEWISFDSQIRPSPLPYGENGKLQGLCSFIFNVNLVAAGECLAGDVARKGGGGERLISD